MSLNINYNPKMTSYLIKQKLFEKSPFLLLDVGASGGIANYWNIFDKDLHAIGFDPVISECDRLNKKTRNPNIKYEPYYIIADKDEFNYPSMDSYTCSLFVRSSAHEAQKISSKSQNSSRKVSKCTKNKISLNQYVKENNLQNPDFIKVDVDGYDYPVLTGANDLLSNPSTLGVMVECQFQGGLGPHSNTFRNIDRLLAEHGFALHDLSINRYSKKVLPQKFSLNLFGQTVAGQAYWGDVLFLRDAHTLKKENLSSPQLLKLACIQEIHGLSDCAAELLLLYRDQLAGVIDIDDSLDLLTQNSGLFPSYKEHLSEFNKKPASFFPSRIQHLKRVFPSLSSDLKRLLSYSKSKLLS